ncbi:MAG TPA: hypothetical protein PLB91_11995 [Spirochaetales bacterium]|nr:hypothetical protein [Spirochaetales bacterium]HRY55722.1 hypothetical protein [Spirochaetia bacterium]HRZ65969.1 hypothetical protein [Spirochaetia bacterium]
MERKQTALVLSIGLLWPVIMVLGWKGAYLPAMILSVLLMFAHLILGAMHEGKVDPVFLAYPILAWAALWILSFVLSAYYADLFRGTAPSFSILGFHPSFAWTVLTYWIGGILTLSVGYYLLRDRWLSEETWSKFKSDIAEIRKAGGKA